MVNTAHIAMGGVSNRIPKVRNVPEHSDSMTVPLGATFGEWVRLGVRAQFSSVHRMQRHYSHTSGPLLSLIEGPHVSSAMRGKDCPGIIRVGANERPRLRKRSGAALGRR
jgi:hypothetical protein